MNSDDLKVNFLRIRNEKQSGEQHRENEKKGTIPKEREKKNSEN